MPTAKPRITITLTEKQHAVLASLSQSQKVSMSSIVVDLIETTLPVLGRLSAVLQNAASAPQAVLDSLKRSAEEAEIAAGSLSGSVMEQLDFLVAASDGMAGAGGPALAGPRAPAMPSDLAASAIRPPSSNRGVRIKTPHAKNALISPMKKDEKNGRAEK